MPGPTRGPKQTKPRAPTDPDHPDAEKEPLTTEEYLSRFSEVYKAATRMEGAPISTNDLVGKRFKVERYFRRKSRFESADEYAAGVQMTPNAFACSTSAMHSSQMPKSMTTL